MEPASIPQSHQGGRAAEICAEMDLRALKQNPQCWVELKEIQSQLRAQTARTGTH